MDLLNKCNQIFAKIRQDFNVKFPTDQYIKFDRQYANSLKKEFDLFALCIEEVSQTYEIDGEQMISSFLKNILITMKVMLFTQLRCFLNYLDQTIQTNDSKPLKMWEDSEIQKLSRHKIKITRGTIDEDVIKAQERNQIEDPSDDIKMKFGISFDPLLREQMSKKELLATLEEKRKNLTLKESKAGRYLYRQIEGMKKHIQKEKIFINEYEELLYSFKQFQFSTESNKELKKIVFSDGVTQVQEILDQITDNLDVNAKKKLMKVIEYLFNNTKDQFERKSVDCQTNIVGQTIDGYETQITKLNRSIYDSDKHIDQVLKETIKKDQKISELEKQLNQYKQLQQTNIAKIEEPSLYFVSKVEEQNKLIEKLNNQISSLNADKQFFYSQILQMTDKQKQLEEALGKKGNNSKGKTNQSGVHLKSKSNIGSTQGFNSQDLLQSSRAELNEQNYEDDDNGNSLIYNMQSLSSNPNFYNEAINNVSSNSKSINQIQETINNKNENNINGLGNYIKSNSQQQGGFSIKNQISIQSQQNNQNQSKYSQNSINQQGMSTQNVNNPSNSIQERLKESMNLSKSKQIQEQQQTTAQNTNNGINMNKNIGNLSNLKSEQQDQFNIQNSIENQISNLSTIRNLADSRKISSSNNSFHNQDYQISTYDQQSLQRLNNQPNSYYNQSIKANSEQNLNRVGINTNQSQLNSLVKNYINQNSSHQTNHNQSDQQSTILSHHQIKSTQDFKSEKEINSSCQLDSMQYLKDSNILLDEKDYQNRGSGGSMTYNSLLPTKDRDLTTLNSMSQNLNGDGYDQNEYFLSERRSKIDLNDILDAFDLNQEEQEKIQSTKILEVLTNKENPKRREIINQIVSVLNRQQNTLYQNSQVRSGQSKNSKINSNTGFSSELGQTQYKKTQSSQHSTTNASQNKTRYTSSQSQHQDQQQNSSKRYIEGNLSIQDKQYYKQSHRSHSNSNRQTDFQKNGTLEKADQNLNENSLNNSIQTRHPYNGSASSSNILTDAINRRKKFATQISLKDHQVDEDYFSRIVQKQEIMEDIIKKKNQIAMSRFQSTDGNQFNMRESSKTNEVSPLKNPQQLSRNLSNFEDKRGQYKYQLKEKDDFRMHDPKSSLSYITNQITIQSTGNLDYDQPKQNFAKFINQHKQSQKPLNLNDEEKFTKQIIWNIFF